MTLKTRAILAFLGIFLLCLILLFATFERRRLAEIALIHMARKYGAEITQLTVEKIGLQESIIQNVAVGKGEKAQRIERIVLRYSPVTLLRSRLNDIAITQPRLRINLAGNALKAEGLHMGFTHNDKRNPYDVHARRYILPKHPEPEAEDPVLPLDTMIVEKGILNVESNQLTLKAPFSFTLTEHKKGDVNLALALNNASAKVLGVDVSGINLGLAFSQLPHALFTAKPQEMRVRKIGFPAPLENGTIIFGVNGDEINILEMIWDWAGGTLKTKDAKFSSYRKAGVMVLDVENIRLHDVLMLLGGKHVRADARLTGFIPIRYHQGGVVIESGKLAAVQPGIVSLPAGSIGIFSGDNAQMELLRKALDNFHHDVLYVTLNHRGGRLAAQLHMEGHNPDLYEGRRIALNVNLSGNVVEAALRSLELYELPTKLVH